MGDLATDVRELRAELGAGLERIHGRIDDLVKALNEHAKDDAERWAIVAVDLAKMGGRVEVLEKGDARDDEKARDRWRYARGLVGSLMLALIAAAAGAALRGL